MSETAHVSIIIPTKNNANDLIDCIDSIANLDYPANRVHITIWDNDSNFGEKEKIRKCLNKIQTNIGVEYELIEYNDNLGVYSSRDQLLKRIPAKSQFILSIDDDVILPKEILRVMIYQFSTRNNLGIIGPKTVYDSNPDLAAHGAGFINWWIGRYNEKHVSEPVLCDYVIGCCMLIKRELIDEINGFDGDYYTSHGEVDYCLKAKKRGFEILYYPNIKVRHRVEHGGTKTDERRYYIYRNKFFVIKKNAPIPQKWIIYFIYLFCWLPKTIFDSILESKKIDIKKIKIIIRATIDGCLNKTGKVF